MRHLAVLLPLVILACQDPYVPPPPPQGTKPCDPLATAAPAPITLATVLSAGRANDGSIYVVDKTPSPQAGVAGERRAFISNGNTLERKKVASVSETEADITLALNNDADFLIKIEHTGYDGPVTRMGIFRGSLSAATTFNLDLEGEVLTFMQASELSSFAVTNSAATDIMYAATGSDGRQLLITQPAIDFTLDKLRVFYGTPDRMVERPLAENGAIITTFTSIIFDVDGVRTIATLTFPQGGNGGGGSARIEQNNRTVATLTPVPGSPGAPGTTADGGAAPKPAASTLTTGLSFLCL